MTILRLANTAMAFQRYDVRLEENIFPILYQSVEWGDFSKGQQIAVLHRPEDDKVPLARTTTVYQNPGQRFSSVHEMIMNEIRTSTGIDDLCLNNAMLEVYDYRYRTMGFHTDQALDLDPDSYICLFTCYEQGGDAYSRVLTVKNKESGEEIEVPLIHHSVVVFSTAMNRAHLHKIEGRNLSKEHANRWMVDGIYFEALENFRQTHRQCAAFNYK